MSVPYALPLPSLSHMAVMKLSWPPACGHGWYSNESAVHLLKTDQSNYGLRAETRSRNRADTLFHCRYFQSGKYFLGKIMVMVNAASSKRTSDAHFQQVDMILKVLMKCLQHTLVKIPQHLLLCQLGSQRPILRHVSLNANQLLLTLPLASIFCVFGGA